MNVHHQSIATPLRLLLFTLNLHILRTAALSVTRNNHPDLHIERNLQKKGYRHIIGSDESGRGCIAGPVLAVSCCIVSKPTEEGRDAFDGYEPIPGVRDSKLLAPGDRLRIYDEISSRSDHAWHASWRSNEEIDSSNILLATMDCFRESIEELICANDFPLHETYSVVDGKKSPKLSKAYSGKVPCRPYVRGDVEVYTVALASIIAKVTRDRFMREEAHLLYPDYNFCSNFGYPSREHVLAVHKHGPSPLHRQSCKPVRGR